MKNKKKILAGLLLFIVLVAGGIVFYYWEQGRSYVKTEDARITANTVTVSPLISGRVASWKGKEGDQVVAGQNLGWLDTYAIASSAGINPNTLGQTGSIAAGKAEITAPVSGQIIKSSIEPGQMVNAGQSLAVIADTEDMYVSANIEETKINKVKVGQDVEITIDSLQNQVVTGKVEEIGKATTSTFSVISSTSSNGSFTKVVQLIPVKIRFAGINQLALLPGMSVEVKIHIADQVNQ